MKTFEVEKVPASLLPSTGKEGALTSLVQGVWQTVEGRRSHLLAGLLTRHSSAPLVCPYLVSSGGHCWHYTALHCTAGCELPRAYLKVGEINLLIERGNYSD